MATPYVPVPVPIGSSTCFATNRNQRRSSLGSISTSSSSSKGQLEDFSNNSFKKMSVPDKIGATSSPCNSPLVRTKFVGMNSSMEYCTQPSEDTTQNTDSGSWEDRPTTPTILGYEVMEERAKFTLKDMFPGFRLALPPKRWFKDNYNPDFLEDRQLGLQAFLQNLVAHKDIANCLAVREFLCLDDPPGPFDSLEESRAFCETLEETNYRLQKELAEKQREVEALKKILHEKEGYIDAMEKRIRDLNVKETKSRKLSGEESECSGEVESSAIEADQGGLGEDNCSEKANEEPSWSSSVAEDPVPEIEVAEVACAVDEEM
ncbi:sorting nexin-16 isoform X3 [Heteronotia binoei]|uniref:sorting nexin-16 isoform X3 n=1 Tax=Heteronotia binoei TaxID=13085 RepID=UPI00292E8CDF|nr:sorting nexin-16 isoform X3 [Heteronotia binoei]